MAKRKNKIVVRPWCWYCEREFEDEKVLMQHQKAKHFKCNQCPRRLNTAGGLAVHIQQVHKLDPDQLPRIENAIPGRDGYEVEIFGMEGIPAPDVADYKRRKEQELGLPAGSISGSGKGLQQNKRPRVENRVLTEEELRVQLAAHRALMGGGDAAPAAPATPAQGGAVYNAAPQTYAAPAVAAPPVPPPFPGMPPPPGVFPGGPPPPGFPSFPPGGFPPGPPPPGFPFPPPPAALLRPGQPLPPLPPGVSPPAPTPATPATPMTPVAAGLAGQGTPTPAPPPGTPGPPPTPTPAPSQTHATTPAPPPAPTPRAPNPPQTNPALKPGTVLVWQDANYSPDEKRAQDPKYRYVPTALDSAGPRGTKRARAEDYM